MQAHILASTEIGGLLPMSVVVLQVLFGSFEIQTFLEK
jgi:hypothetical protein